MGEFFEAESASFDFPAYLGATGHFKEKGNVGEEVKARKIAALIPWSNVLSVVETPDA